MLVDYKIKFKLLILAYKTYTNLAQFNLPALFTTPDQI